MRVTKNIVLSDSNNKVAALEEFLIYLLWFEYSYFFHAWVWQALAPLLLLTSWLFRFNQVLEGSFRDPGFDQNMVRDSEKRKISWRDWGFDYSKGSGIRQNLVTGCGIFVYLSGTQESFMTQINVLAAKANQPGALSV